MARKAHISGAASVTCGCLRHGGHGMGSMEVPLRITVIRRATHCWTFVEGLLVVGQQQVSRSSALAWNCVVIWGASVGGQAATRGTATSRRDGWRGDEDRQ
jgi:hypothetical protein